MGLMGSYLCGPLYCGGTGVYMSPFTFVRNPPLWIETVSKYKVMRSHEIFFQVF